VHEDYEEDIHVKLTREQQIRLASAIPASYRLSTIVVPTTMLLAERMRRGQKLGTSKVVEIPPSAEVYRESQVSASSLKPGFEKKSFIFFPFAAGPESNYEIVLIAYHLYRTTSPEPAKLVLSVREPDLLEPKLEELLEHFRLKKEVQILHDLPDEEELAYYRSALFVLLPSLSRGLELPMLHALSTGSVVAASDAENLRELYGNAAYFLDPRKPEELAAVMKVLATDSSLRERLRHLACERATQISKRDPAEVLLRACSIALSDATDVGDDSIGAEPSKRVDGIYSDRWIAPTASVTFTQEYRFNKFHFVFEAHAMPHLLPLRMKFILNRKVIGEYLVPAAGNHEFTIPLKGKSLFHSSTINELLISSDKSFVPQKLGMSEDRRELVVQAITLEGTAESGDIITFYAGH
jgi:hypothetical protein